MINMGDCDGGGIGGFGYDVEIKSATIEYRNTAFVYKRMSSGKIKFFKMVKEGLIKKRWNLEHHCEVSPEELPSDIKYRLGLDKQTLEDI